MNAWRFPIRDWLRMLSPAAIFTVGLLYELALGAADLVTPAGMNFEPFYLLGIAFVGWGAGARPAALLSVLSVVLLEGNDWYWRRTGSEPVWVIVWNVSTRLFVLAAAGWLSAEVTRLTRHLGMLVEHRTAQWKAEAEQHKATAARLADTLELNQTMIAASPMGIVAYRASGECVFANEALARIAGGSRDQVLKGNFLQLEGWRKSGLLELAEQTLAQGQPRSGEFCDTTRFGKKVWVDAQMTPFVSGGEPHLLGMFYDISDRKRAELLLRTQRDVGVSLSLTSDLTAAFNSLLDFALHLEGIDCGGAYLTDATTGDLHLATYRGEFSPEFLERVRFYPASSERAQMVAKGQPLYDSYENLVSWHDRVRDREELRAVGVVPLHHEGRSIGALNLASHSADTIPPQSRTLVETIAAQAAGAIGRIRTENALLESQADRLRLQRQILEISDREQARLGQEIHDDLCQQLVSLAFDANSLERQLTEQARPEAATARRIARFLDEAITGARQLAQGLFPVRLKVEGLGSALEELAKSTQERFQVPCRLEKTTTVSVGSQVVATHLYRIAQEAVSNAVKHGRPAGIAIRLQSRNDQIELQVEDNGAGFESSTAIEQAGMGLHIMEYRARSLGGTVHVGLAPGGGTLVVCTIPYESGGPGEPDNAGTGASAPDAPESPLHGLPDAGRGVTRDEG